MKVHYVGKLLPTAAELDDLSNFDDRSLATLAGSNVAHPSDDMSDLLRSLDRWGDRPIKAVRS